MTTRGRSEIFPMMVAALVAMSITGLTCLPAMAQAPSPVKATKKEVRESRSRVTPLDIPVTKDQPIYVKRFRADSVELLGEGWPSEEAKKLEIERILDMIESQVRARLIQNGYRCIVKRDAASAGAELEANAVIVGGVLSKAGMGLDHPVVDVSVTVTAAKDPAKVYGQFTDGGIVDKVTNRIAGRIAGKGGNSGSADTAAEFSRTR